MKTPAHYQVLEARRLLRLIDQWSYGEPLRVLDFGCGRGRLLFPLAQHGCVVTGSDINPDYVAELRHARVDAWSPEEVLGGGSRYDVVILSHLIEHLPPAELQALIPRLIELLTPGGRMVVITPLPGERFFHDSTHIRPYTPQSFRHAFGQDIEPVSVGGQRLLELEDIYFFRDPVRSRHQRAFYRHVTLASPTLAALNFVSNAAWRLSGGRVGVVASWLGIYRALPHQSGEVRDIT